MSGGKAPAKNYSKIDMTCTDMRWCLAVVSVGNVLQKLNPDDWDSERIDELLAAGADTNMDGKLQIDEFMRWIFAEDSVADYQVNKP